MAKKHLTAAGPAGPGPALVRSGSALRPGAAGFPIVGIGASAGGLEALEQFLAHVPGEAGMAIVIVQHLDPTHEGVMAELLQRATAMGVVEAKERTRVRPGFAYVIPPNRDMAIRRGVLHLQAPTAPRGLRLPIDFFLRSLAEDRRELGIAVILSGMGSDGTLGVRAIKEQGGLVLVQDPGAAKFDGMPRSVVDAGLADVVAPAGELPGRILDCLRQRPVPAREGVVEAEVVEPRASGLVDKVVALLRRRTGHDFSLYKRTTLHRRIERRMGLHRIPRMSGYVRYLEENAAEQELLFKELLIGVTRFFRDRASWEQLRDTALPGLLENLGAGRVLRAWVAGCSTGEEAYSLAMVFKEAAGRMTAEGKVSLQIFATDLDRDAIERARQGLFTDEIAADVSPERLRRFFIKEGRRYRVKQEIREMILFAPHNLVMDPPFTKLDLISCRNLLIYLTPEAQEKLVGLFHYSLVPGGILFLGSAETIGGEGGLFAPLVGKARIFRRLGPVPRREPVEFPSSFTRAPDAAGGLRAAAKSPPGLQAAVEQLILRRYAPPAVLANERGDILFISGRTGNYLEPAAGRANWNLFAMAREGLRYDLGNGFQKALRCAGPVVVRGLKTGRTGREQRVDATLQRVVEPGELQGCVMVVFNEVPAEPSAKLGGRGLGRGRGRGVAGLERALLQVRAEARNAQAEMQISQEALRTANEELQSANEELQSANEELMTSKEEMQSLNEELQTVNAELQAKVDELSRAGDDMKNLLNSTHIATLFLDARLNVRRFTPQAAGIIRLIAADVGRPITDLATELRYPELARDARQVLRNLTVVEKPIPARDGRWFSVRIMPYRTVDDRIDGLVITFADITAAKALEARLRGRRGRKRPAVRKARKTVRRGEAGKPARRGRA